MALKDVVEIFKTIGAIMTPFIPVLIWYLDWKTKRKLNEVHEQMNGNQEKLLEVVSVAKLAEGNLQGQQQRKDEQEPINAANIIAARAEGKLEGIEEQKNSN